MFNTSTVDYSLIPLSAKGMVIINFGQFCEHHFNEENPTLESLDWLWYIKLNTKRMPNWIYAGT